MSYLIDFEPLLKTEYSKKFDEIRKGLDASELLQIWQSIKKLCIR